MHIIDRTEKVWKCILCFPSQKFCFGFLDTRFSSRSQFLDSCVARFFTLSQIEQRQGKKNFESENLEGTFKRISCNTVKVLIFAGYYFSRFFREIKIREN